MVEMAKLKIANVLSKPRLKISTINQFSKVSSLAYSSQIDISDFLLLTKRPHIIVITQRLIDCTSIEVIGLYDSLFLLKNVTNKKKCDIIQ